MTYLNRRQSLINICDCKRKIEDGKATKPIMLVELNFRPFRFTKADEDGNGSLNKREFADFIHPEQSSRMKDLVITETIEDIDRNGDGMISLIWDSKQANDTTEPDWVKVERENFRKYRDLDHDGKMNRKEVELWLMPTDYDNIQAETEPLFHEADADQVNFEDDSIKSAIGVFSCRIIN